jgi:hypothetical protein
MSNKDMHSIYTLVKTTVMTIMMTATNKQTNSVALVRERTIPTERPPPVGEVSAINSNNNNNYYYL